MAKSQTAQIALERLKPLSPKAMASVFADGWMTVWEGAIRSGKTVASLIAWLRYIQSSKERIFFMTGKSHGSLMRNCIIGDFGLLNLAYPYAVLTKDEAGTSVIKIGDKVIYLFGANDSGSYLLLKGLTAGGWYADEVSSHPENYITEALARTAVSTDRRNFWTLNPCMPSHYIYTKFTDTWEGLPGYRRYHFVLADNNAMPIERRKELERQFHGRYYQMLILGLRVTAEGQIYSDFNRDEIIYTEQRTLHGVQHYICCDYGSVNPCVFLDCCIDSDGIIWVSREYRWDSREKMMQKTDAQYVQDMRDFIGPPDDTDCIIVVDPSAVSFITALQVEGYFVKAAENAVSEGIAKLASIISQRRLKIHESCVGLISEMEGYSWDERSVILGEEKPVKVRDHGPDALRYYVNTCLTSFDLLPQKG